MDTVAMPDAGRRTRWRSVASDLLALTRPRLAAEGLVVLVLTYAIAAADAPRWAAFAVLLAGGSLVLGAASALNQALECGVDARMTRTAGRPIPAGRVSRARALAFGAALGASGLAALALGVGPEVAALAGVGLFAYLALYTPLKRRSPAAIGVGAAAGAVPVLMGWAGAGRPLDSFAWTLWTIVFLWQLPHFLAVAWLHAADYERAGLRMVPFAGGRGPSPPLQVMGCAAALLGAALVPALRGWGGGSYLIGAIVLSACLVGFALTARPGANPRAARMLLRVSVAYLPAILLLMAVDRHLR